MHNFIYEGRIQHRRYDPIAHQFQYRLFMVYLDLDELPELFKRVRLLSSRKWACLSFLEGDHLTHQKQPLSTAIHETVESHTGRAPRGPIRLLTQLRYCGYYFSPLNLYYCFDPQGIRVETIVAEVNNTPWKEQHCYVLWDANRTSEGRQLRFSHAKDFHVSPFMDMNSEYHWRVSVPTSSLYVELRATENNAHFFDAMLTARRRPLDSFQLARAMARYPIMTGQITGAIYYQALRIWMKRCPFFPHPNKRTTSTV